MACVTCIYITVAPRGLTGQRHEITRIPPGLANHKHTESGVQPIAPFSLILSAAPPIGFVHICRWRTPTIGELTLFRSRGLNVLDSHHIHIHVHILNIRGL